MLTGAASSADEPTDELVVAKRGDSISKMLGTSDPEAIGNFMRANGLRSSTIYAGQEYVIPGEVYDSNGNGDLGQATLNSDNARLEQMAAAKAEDAAMRQANADAVFGPRGSGQMGQMSFLEGPDKNYSGGDPDGGGVFVAPREGEAVSDSRRVGVKEIVCGAIPSGRTTGVSIAIGGVGATMGGFETVLNYKSGEESAFVFGGQQVIGWNGAASISVNNGVAYGLNDDNRNYKGGFTGVNGAMGVSGHVALGGFLATSSDGVKNPIPSIFSDAKDVVFAGGVSVSAGVHGQVTGGVAVTEYSAPIPLGRQAWWTMSPFDVAMYAMNQWCR